MFSERVLRVSFACLACCSDPACCTGVLGVLGVLSVLGVLGVLGQGPSQCPVGQGFRILIQSLAQHLPGAGRKDRWTDRMLASRCFIGKIASLSKLYNVKFKVITSKFFCSIYRAAFIGLHSSFSVAILSL